MKSVFLTTEELMRRERKLTGKTALGPFTVFSDMHRFLTED
jgi:hypothetical protein